MTAAINALAVIMFVASINKPPRAGRKALDGHTACWPSVVRCVLAHNHHVSVTANKSSRKEYVASLNTTN
jgi:hypothetical protein